MAVHAHPDDESSKGAATMARYVREGAQVLVATMTGGERGDILNPAMDRPEIAADITRVRREEMARAREILGVEQRFLGTATEGVGVTKWNFAERARYRLTAKIPLRTSSSMQCAC